VYQVLVETLTPSRLEKRQIWFTAGI